MGYCVKLYFQITSYHIQQILVCTVSKLQFKAFVEHQIHVKKNYIELDFFINSKLLSQKLQKASFCLKRIQIPGFSRERMQCLRCRLTCKWKTVYFISTFVSKKIEKLKIE